MTKITLIVLGRDGADYFVGATTQKLSAKDLEELKTQYNLAENDEIGFREIAVYDTIEQVKNLVNMWGTNYIQGADESVKQVDGIMKHL